MNSAFARDVRRQLLLLGAFVGMSIGALISAAEPSLAMENEVECNSIKIHMQDTGYDTICRDENVSDITIESLEANSTDGSHFLVVADLHTNYGYIFNTRGLRESLGDMFSELSFEHWRGGNGEQGLTTSEFDSEYKTVPSTCVGFQKYVSREQWGGWRRHIVGFGCSRTGNREDVYKALKLIDFP
jgi:hypothetical protein